MSMPEAGTPQFQLKRRLRRLRRTVSGSVRAAIDALRRRSDSALHSAKAVAPLLIDEKTYNVAHLDYESELVRNFPDRIFNDDRSSANPLLAEIRKMAKRDKVPRKIWQQVCQDMMAEAATVPGFDLVMERMAFIENYMTALGQRYHSHYLAGWVNLTDAQFLYWIVRRLKPKTILQTGVSNGLSSAFMMLALAKNGAEGSLHGVDVPAIFDPADPMWTRQGAVFGFVIPEGKTSGWMVPDIYRDRFEVQIGDAKKLLPPLVDRLAAVDMFYHDSDHRYNHMMFEFEQAKRKLAPNGVVVADDISWNASLWDFADKYRLPSYNYCGSMGVSFLSGKA
jgi:predicted O-methyltransferase YrrM